MQMTRRWRGPCIKELKKINRPVSPLGSAKQGQKLRVVGPTLRLRIMWTVNKFRPSQSQILVHREHGQVQFKPPSLHHNFTPLPRPPVRRDLQPVARNSIGMSVPSYSAKSPIAPLASYSHPFGGPNIRPITPGAAGARVVSRPTSPRTAAISGTGVMHRGVGPSQIGGPAH